MLPEKINKIEELISLYHKRLTQIPTLLEKLHDLQNELRNICNYGIIGESRPIFNNKNCDFESLIKSSNNSWWKSLVQYHTNIDYLFSKKDKDEFEQLISKPIDISLDQVKLLLGDFVKNPRYHLLKGVAEVFTKLDNAYKSHSKVKIGVEGLPKRIIINCYNDSISFKREKILPILKVLALLKNKEIPTYQIVEKILKEQKCLDLGIEIKFFKNNNIHIFFSKETLHDINLALAEFYGDVLADDSAEFSNKKTSTSVAKDLQFYPTPTIICDSIIKDLKVNGDTKILEPSCGEGNFIKSMLKHGANPDNIIGVEFDSVRANKSRENTKTIIINNNFLEIDKFIYDFDYIIMNPPFYGKHFLKHIEHAFNFLKNGGTLISIVPATAQYDFNIEKYFKEKFKNILTFWKDLPIGSFSTSGTNICTGKFTIVKKSY